MRSPFPLTESCFGRSAARALRRFEKFARFPCRGLFGEGRSDELNKSARSCDPRQTTLDRSARTLSDRSEIVALCGGVGAARFLRGLLRAVPAERVAAVINTGDDATFYGVHVSPDLDSVTYTLAGVVDEERGYGLHGDTFHLLTALEQLGEATWFRLGDRDFATCLHRTLKLHRGESLTCISDALRRCFGVNARLLPMSDALCPTRIERADGTRCHFQEYFVRDGAPPDAVGVDLRAAQSAAPAAGVLETIAAARTILVCPSNPVVSIGPILALQGLRDVLRNHRAPIVAVSPLVGGAPVKGPAHHLLRAIGSEVSVRGVAELYVDFLDGFAIDHHDADAASAVEALGIRCTVMDALMPTPERAEALARSALALAEQCR